MKKIDMNDVTAAAKTLLEIGGVVTVDDDYYILTDGKPVGVVVGKTSGLPIRLLHEGMQHGEYRVLNPFMEASNASKERAWLFNIYAALPGRLIKQALVKMVEIATDESDDNIKYKNLPLVLKYVKTIDKRMLKEFEEIRGMDILFIDYDQKQKKATTYSNIIERSDKFEVRKKTKEFIYEVMEDIFGGSMENLDKIEYVAKVKNAQQLDAMLNVLGKILDYIASQLTMLLGIEFDMNEFHRCKDNIEAYAQVSHWCVSSAPPIDGKEDNVVDKPWVVNQTSAIPQRAPVFQQYEPGMSTPDPSEIATPGPTREEELAKYRRRSSGVGGDSWFDQQAHKPSGNVPQLNTYPNIPGLIHNPGFQQTMFQPQPQQQMFGMACHNIVMPG